MGHFITSRRYRVDVTLPYFIPAPTLFGTLGAVIKMRSPIRKKTMLLGYRGRGTPGGNRNRPAAGGVGSVPVPDDPGNGGENNRISFSAIPSCSSFLSYLIVGTIPEGYDIMLSPIAFAGWVGFLVTSLNLMPMGQLDGGHIAYALFGRRQRIVSRVFVGVLVVLGIVYYAGWLVWAALVLIIGVDHPPVSDDDVGLDRRRRVIGWFCFLLFIVTFIPVPVKMDFRKTYSTHNGVVTGEWIYSKDRGNTVTHDGFSFLVFAGPPRRRGLRRVLWRSHVAVYS